MGLVLETPGLCRKPENSFSDTPTKAESLLCSAEAGSLSSQWQLHCLPQDGGTPFGAFRDFLRERGNTLDEQELIAAAKFMGRWRSGAPACSRSRTKTTPSWVPTDRQLHERLQLRRKMDPYGYACQPLAHTHIRRMNPARPPPAWQRPQDGFDAGAPYGPALPEGATEDRVGSAASQPLSAAPASFANSSSR